MFKIMTHSVFTAIAQAAAAARREREEQALAAIRTSWYAQLERAAENHSGTWLQFDCVGDYPSAIQLDCIGDYPTALCIRVIREYRDAGWEVREYDFAIKLPSVIA